MWDFVDGGLRDVDIEMEIQKITVTGCGLEERKVSKAIKRAGKTAEPWPYPYPGYSYVADHYDTWRDADDQSINTFVQTPAADYSLPVVSLFSDDNPHACAIM
ncbi:heavy metal-associated isoprenylated plant protein 31-like [Olea europaea var. sylvestris]|uniref:heavy metal-associated isoprenylated plant protein 31-like n=1 Tax=Olea europaea var. sylvestris TaxID=158386 RepID=UPI000C1CEB48|nr:heavy metal-associated isoprenylated plant protein 31-like [Olea europaea var. sylvestris]